MPPPKGDDDNHKRNTLNMNARIFVANVPTDDMTPKQLKERFLKYGNVTDTYLGKSFAFVQFDNAENADAAIQGETGTFINDKKIECSLAKKQPRSQRNDGVSGGPGGVGGRPLGMGGGPKFRERSPLRGGYDDRYDGRRFDDFDRLPRDFRDDPYRDPYLRELVERDAQFSSMELRDSRKMLDPLDLAGLPSLSNSIKESEMRITMIEKESDLKTMVHQSTLQMLREQHEMKMEILKLEKQAMELKILKLMKAFNGGAQTNAAVQQPASDSYQQQSGMMYPQGLDNTSRFQNSVTSSASSILQKPASTMSQYGMSNRTSNPMGNKLGQPQVPSSYGSMRPSMGQRM